MSGSNPAPPGANAGPTVNEKPGLGLIGWLIIFVLVGLMGLAALWFLPERRTAADSLAKSENRQPAKPGVVNEGFNPPARTEIASQEPAKPGTGRSAAPQAVRRPVPSSMVAYSAPAPPPPPATPAPDAKPAKVNEPAAEPPKPAKLAGMQVLEAETIDDASWFLMPGNVLQCTNTQPLTERSGASWTAQITEEIRGQDGSRILLPRYSMAYGKVLKGFEFGERRLAAVITHIQGPSVTGQPTLIVPLGVGQVGDALGRIDLEGNIETHFGSRLATVAAYAGLDLVARVGTGVASNQLNRAINGNGRDRDGNDVNINLGNFGGMGTGRGLAGRAMDEELRRPPNFDRPQNFPCSIMINQPIDFRKALRIGK